MSLPRPRPPCTFPPHTGSDRGWPPAASSIAALSLRGGEGRLPASASSPPPGTNHRVHQALLQSPAPPRDVPECRGRSWRGGRRLHAGSTAAIGGAGGVEYVRGRAQRQFAPGDGLAGGGEILMPNDRPLLNDSGSANPGGHVMICPLVSSIPLRCVRAGLDPWRRQLQAVPSARGNVQDIRSRFFVAALHPETVEVDARQLGTEVAGRNNHSLRIRPVKGRNEAKGVVQQAAMPVRLPTHTRPVISGRFACRFAHGGQRRL